jgi:hypothetical protein
LFLAGTETHLSPNGGKTIVLWYDKIVQFLLLSYGGCTVLLSTLYP